jgi:transcriptional regulator with XRE-family HTH domain
MPTRRVTAAGAFLDRLRRAREGGPLTVGAALRAIRLGEEESLAAFAARLGVTKQYLSDVEHDRRGVSVDRAAAWARALGYHVGR